MTHIGYIDSYFPDKSLGVIIDAHKVAHIFSANSNNTFSSEQFVTYEGEDEIVNDVIPLEDYNKFESYKKWKRTSIQWCSPAIIYLVNKNGDRYRLVGPEKKVAERFILNHPLKPSKAEPISEEDYNAEFAVIEKSVEYVSSHIQEIADSYKVLIENHFYSKPGGDDYSCMDRKVQLSYRDSYLDKFFLENEVLYSERSYFISNRSGNCNGRDLAEEERGKVNFQAKYSKNDHLCLRLYKLNERLSNMAIRAAKERMSFSDNWEANIDFGWFYTKSEEESLDDLLKIIREYNNSKNSIFVGNDFEEYK